MDAGGGGWGLMTIIGPIVLAAVLLFALLRNRASKVSIERTEEATRENYKRQDAIDKAKDNEVKR